jgi:hypothetical protein
VDAKSDRRQPQQSKPDVFHLGDGAVIVETNFNGRHVVKHHLSGLHQQRQRQEACSEGFEPPTF